MQTVSDTYRTLLQSGRAYAEWKITIGGVEYFSDRLYRLTTRGSVFNGDTPGIGGTVSREIDLKVRSSGPIPTAAELRPCVRLTDGETASEWLPKGVFYVDTRREVPPGSGVFEMHGYCGMLKGTQPFAVSGDQGDWPMADLNVVREAAERMGTSVDARTVEIMTKGYMIDYPGYGEAGYTILEVLGYIAAMYAGNFVMSDAGELLLLPLRCVSDTDTEPGCLINEDGQYITLGGVRIRV